MTQAEFKFRRGNPDVLTSIANLSNDEVFTPPEFANRMLDTLQEAWASSKDGANIWEDSSVTFLDPFTKSGVFLREITERLTHGLAKEFPDLQERVNHILTKQVFGIGITQLTALLARRSVYCSKWANGEHSIATAFDDADGNIWFQRTEHTWVGGKDKIIVVNAEGVEKTQTTDGKCKYCGASQKDYDREKSSESHAYSFIHKDRISETINSFFGDNVKFDVIVGNPPYQLSDGGGSGTSAAPIYQLFIDQGKKLEPAMMSMVVPARWFSGGKGLDEFRETMLQDSRLRVIHDFPDSSEVFPGVQIKGGVCYFLWERSNPGDVRVVTHDKGEVISEAVRPLLEPGLDVFIRYNEAIAILRKVVVVENPTSLQTLQLPPEKKLSNLVSARKPFGLDSNFRGSSTEKPGDILIYQAGGKSFTSRANFPKDSELLDKWKVFIPFLASGSDSFPHPILGKPFVGSPGTASTETYLAIGPFDSESECQNLISYISTRFFRFLVLLIKPSQNATRKVYDLVPIQGLDEELTDSALFEKYGISEAEIQFIESMVRPMGDSDE